MSNFVSYYESEIERYGGFENYVKEKAREKRPLLQRVVKYALNKKIIEAGCGTATASIFLAKKGFNPVAIDLDKEMLDFAKSNSKSFSNQPDFQEKHILEMPKQAEKFDVAFSHGVLEHFSDKGIVELINAQLNFANTLVISIPSDFFRQDQAINGDERFMSVAKWREIISQSEGDIVEEFSYFYDPDNLKLKVLKFIFDCTGGVLPTKKPYIGFVIQKHVRNS